MFLRNVLYIHSYLFVEAPSTLQVNNINIQSQYFLKSFHLKEGKKPPKTQGVTEC